MLSVLELLFIILMKLSKYLRALVELRSGVKLAVWKHGVLLKIVTSVLKAVQDVNLMLLQSRL